jgi:Suppressor of fused protein (SUFU)
VTGLSLGASRDSNSGLVRHLEQHLGRIENGTRAVDHEGRYLPFQVVRYAVAAGEVASTYSTLGLSRHALQQTSGPAVRIELVVRAAGDVNAFSWLSVLAEQALADHVTFARGEVSDTLDPIAPGSSLTAFYFTAPVFWPDSFATCTDGAEPIHIVMALPVSTPEQRFIRSHGWTAFEELLDTSEVDLADVNRREVGGVH